MGLKLCCSFVNTLYMGFHRCAERDDDDDWKIYRHLDRIRGSNHILLFRHRCTFSIRRKLNYWQTMKICNVIIKSWSAVKKNAFKLNQRRQPTLNMYMLCICWRILNLDTDTDASCLSEKQKRKQKMVFPSKFWSVHVFT